MCGRSRGQRSQTPMQIYWGKVSLTAKVNGEVASPRKRFGLGGEEFGSGLTIRKEKVLKRIVFENRRFMPKGECEHCKR